MYEATASCPNCGWAAVVTAHDTMQLRNEVYGAVNRHVCHEPIPDSCGVAWGDHRCTTAPYDHQFHLCRCGAHTDGGES